MSSRSNIHLPDTLVPQVEHKDRLQLMIDSISDLISYIDVDLRYQFVNCAYEKLLGLKERDIQGRLVKEIVEKSSYQLAEPALKKALGGEEVRFENTITDTAGLKRYIEVEYVPDKDSAGIVRGVIVVGHDITERKRQEDQQRFLASASKVLGSSLDYEKTIKNVSKLAVPDIADWCAVEILDAHNELQSVSVAHTDPKKVQLAKELRKKYPQSMDSPTGVPEVIRSGRSLFYPVITDEMIVSSARDEEHLRITRQVGFTSLMVVPLEARGKIIGALTLVSAESKRVFTEKDLIFAEELATRAAIAVDNSRLYHDLRIAAEEIAQLNEALEVRVLERTEQLLELNKELERSNTELQDFAYVASHDLQEPLRKITAFSNLLIKGQGENLSEETRQHIEIIQKASRRMSTLINDLLNYSRVTTQAQPFKKVDMDRLVAEVLDDLDVRIQQTGATITRKGLCFIEGDALQIRQLVQNILSNALKYHKEGIPPKIHIEATQNNDVCTLTIEDNGIGFDEIYLDKIFTIFQRLHGKDLYEGTGIGLAICKKIVERHNGSITAKSRVGEGSTFIISLPVKQ